MSVWEKATLAAATPGAKVTVDSNGTSWVRILSPSHRRNDGVNDYATIGYGHPQIIQG